MTFGQEDTIKYSVLVIDAISSYPLPSSSVTLFNVENRYLESSLTDSSGITRFYPVPRGRYEVSVSSVGYQSSKVEVDLKNIYQLDTIRLSVNEKALQEIVVTGTKPMVTMDIDKLSYNVEADDESKFLSLLDILKKVPMLSVDGNDNLKLKGSGSFRIFINGRPSSMFANNPKEALRAISASSVQKVEVITNPPSKYDGEGLIGIVNIVMKKRTADGYNGRVNLRYSYPSGPGFSSNLSAKAGKFEFMFLGIYTNFRDPSSKSQNSIESYLNKSLVKQNGMLEYKGHFFSPSVEISYNVDSLNLISIVANANTEINKSNSFLESNLIDSLAALRFQNLSNNDRRKFDGFDIGVNYQRSFKKSNIELFTASYQFLSGREAFDNAINIEDRVSLMNSYYSQYNIAKNIENTFQIDYVKPIRKFITIEMGAKSIIRRNDSGNEISELSKKNFKHLQNVYSIYNSYEIRVSNYVIKLGGRYEYTDENRIIMSVQNDIKSNYGSFLPSVSLQKEFSNLGLFKLSFGKRIQRPNIYQLNPFIDSTNPNVTLSGNPFLLPVKSQNIELGFSRFGYIKTFITASYANSKNNILAVRSIVNDSVATSRFDNIGTHQTFDLNISARHSIGNSFTLNLNGSLKYIWLDGSYDGNYIKNEGARFNGTLNVGYTFEKGWRTGLTLNGWTGDVLLQGRGMSYFSTTLNLSKEVIKGKGTIAFSAVNPYQKYVKFKTTIETPDFSQNNLYYYYARRFSLSFAYRFGKMKGGINTNQRRISNDDLDVRKSSGAF